MRIEVDGALLEAVVFDEVRAREAAGDLRCARRYHRDLEAIYGRPPGDERETAARERHARWFEQLGLDASLRAAAIEAGPSLGRADRLLVHAVATSQAEGADLHGRPSPELGREELTVIVSLRPGRFRDGEALRRFLRHELRLVADLLDPTFGRSAAPAPDARTRDRYRLLWGISAEGRSARAGLPGLRPREASAEEFDHVFRSLPAETRRAAFDRLYDGPRPSHAALLSLAEQPAETMGGGSGGGAPGARCPLCRFPTFDWADPEAPIPGRVLARIRAAFPDWAPERGACRECVDRYSLASTGALPVPSDP
ncbi:MAG TPA: hypothetical protein VFI25_15340 [Planctomycetota bacterium]|jgi:hypothetical protein|nr:hypothetical protein [Planctomycetota bacterium]